MAIFPIILPITGGASRAEQHSFTGSSAWIAWENPGDFPCGFSEKKTSGSQSDENGDMIGILFWGQKMSPLEIVMYIIVYYCDLQGCEGEYIGDTTGVNQQILNGYQFTNLKCLGFWGYPNPIAIIPVTG